MRTSAARRLNRLPWQNLRPRSSRSPCVNHALAGAVRCASSRSSVAARNQCRAPHRGSRPHDEVPVPLHASMSTGLRSAGDVTLRPTTPGSSSHWKIGETHLLASIQRQKPTAGQRRRQHNRHHLDQRGIDRQRSFPIELTKPLAASSFRGLSTPAATSWKSTSLLGPHRKTFRTEEG